MKLGEFADIVRSKNAGIHRTTIDVLFKDEKKYELLKEYNNLSAAKFAELYGLAEEDVDFYWYDSGFAFKITIPSGISSGSPGDRDLRAAQQHVPVYELEINIE